MENIYYKHWVFLVTASAIFGNLLSMSEERSLEKSVILIAVMVICFILFAFYYEEDKRRWRLYKSYRRYYETGNNILNYFFSLNNKDLCLFFSGFGFAFLDGLKKDIEKYLLEGSLSDWQMASAIRVYNVLTAYMKDMYNQ